MPAHAGIHVFENMKKDVDGRICGHDGMGRLLGPLVLHLACLGPILTASVARMQCGALAECLNVYPSPSGRNPKIRSNRSEYNGHTSGFAKRGGTEPIAMPAGCT